MIDRLMDMLRSDGGGGRKRLFIIGGGVLLLVAIGGGYFLFAGGDDTPGANEIDFSFAEAVGDTAVGEDGLPLTIEERVEQTIAAQIPTPTPEPTPNVPATLAFEAQESREARQGLGGGNLGSLPDNGTQPGVVGSRLLVSDERYLAAMGRPIWLAAHVHLDLDRLLNESPAALFQTLKSDDTRLRIQQMETDIATARRDIDAQSSARDGLSGPIKGYARYIEDTVGLMDAALRDIREMYVLSSRGAASYSELTLDARAEYDRWYNNSHQLSEDFAFEMSRHGCSICGELYRGREETN